MVEDVGVVASIHIGAEIFVGPLGFVEHDMPAAFRPEDVGLEVGASTVFGEIEVHSTYSVGNGLPWPAVDQASEVWGL